MRLFALTCGWLTGHLGGFLKGEHGRLKVPVPCYLVEHPKGLLLFDAGMHPAVAHDPAPRLGAVASFFEVHAAAGDDVGGRLAALGVDAGRVQWLVNSHLHFDHAGGNACVPNARLVVQRREWEAAQDPDLRARNFFDPQDWDLGHDRLVVDAEHDVFGDGRVVCLPTYGHTPGHQSLRVRLDGGAEVVLAADACYLRRTLEALHLPTVAHDETQMLESLHRLRALQAAGARIFYGHDPEFWTTVPQAPVAVG